MSDFLELMVSVGEAGGIYSLAALAYLITFWREARGELNSVPDRADRTP